MSKRPRVKFNETNFLDRFSEEKKKLKYQVSSKHVVGAEFFHADKQRDRHDKANSALFSNFAKASKNKTN
jgi:hypothetical protein